VILKKIKENIFCESMAVITVVLAGIDMFFLDFDLEYFTNNIMWFAIIIFVIVSNIISLREDIIKYRCLKQETLNEDTE